ncbi:MAG: tRNA (adenosine(37)-N6)-threonylcarbamoyltransferase complex dimerization subunit type 1 TsaB [Candidatus Omnitrophica bacterium]|nr:tRNA (adenosine(37)-N6)-threonylcarbamoyltransferase complex dimerization subunit type 1 TsaB [Candidatus Omnitrophota bacterium]
MNILAFETSSQVLSVAVKKENGPVSEIHIQGFMKHAENLLPSINTLLKRKKLNIAQIDTCLIGAGPGSFTGLRIGFATLKSLQLVRSRLCYGAVSTDIIAENADLPDHTVLEVCLDARRQKIYHRTYLRTNGHWVATATLRVLDADEWLGQIPAGAYLAGDACIQYGDRIKKELKTKKIHFLPESFWYPRASSMIRWVPNKGLVKSPDVRLKPLKTAADFQPLYFRLSEAEEKRALAVSP